MSAPEEITKADPLDADPSLAGAPLNVRKASAWLEAQAKLPGAWQLKVLGLVPITLLFTGFFAGGITADVFHSPPAAGAFVIGGMVAATVSGVYAFRKLKPTAYANALVQRYRQLQELGPPVEKPDLQSSSPIDRMVARIEALAGDERAAARDAARNAAVHARRLQSELDHLSKISTGQPEADAALDAARDKIEADLARTQARVAELYASLVDLQTGGPTEDLTRATAQIAADLEVDARLAAARRAATKQRS